MDKEILARFLSNECSYPECESVARFLENNEHELDQVKIFENFHEDNLIRNSQRDREYVLRTILPTSRKTGNLVRILIAAVVLVFAAFSLNKYGSDNLPAFVDSSSWVVLENTTQSSQWHLLPDSSRVRLEPQARVRYHPDFNTDRKLTQLAGEATYYVQSDLNYPFRVINQGVKTRALGTIFSVADYDSDNLIVTLLEGEIAVEDEGRHFMNQVLLKNRAALIVNKADFTYQLVEEEKPGYTHAWEVERGVEKSIHTSGSIAWSNRVVNFNGVSNADLFSIMERLFLVTIDVENPEMTNGNFTGQLYQDDNLENLLTIFCEINGCTFTIKDNIIKIR
ncbi:MAG: FecR family protein [Sphingobacterium sp.]